MTEQKNTQTATEDILVRCRQWVAAAKDIVRALKQKTPEEALTYFKHRGRNCGKMTVASLYEEAAATLKTAIQVDKRAAKNPARS